MTVPPTILAMLRLVLLAVTAAVALFQVSARGQTVPAMPPTTPAPVPAPPDAARRVALVGVEISATGARIAFAARKLAQFSGTSVTPSKRALVVVTDAGEILGRVAVPEVRLCHCSAGEDHVEGDVVVRHRVLAVVKVPWLTGTEEIRLVDFTADDTPIQTVRLGEVSVAPR